MEKLLELALQYFPITVIIVIGIIYSFLKLLREFKEIFLDKGKEEENLFTKLKYLFCFWLKRKKKIFEPKHIQYSNEERERIIDKLLIHNFFISINNIKLLQIPNMRFGSTKKNKILRDVIRIYVETVEKYAINILKNYKLDELETSRLNEILLHEIESTDFEIYQKMRMSLGEDLYNTIIEDPVRGFKVRNSIFKEIFINGVTLISSQAMSVYNYDNYERASEILTSMYVSLNVIVKNFEKVFKEFNGELDQYLK